MYEGDKPAVGDEIKVFSERGNMFMKKRAVIKKINGDN